MFLCFTDYLFDGCPAWRSVSDCRARFPRRTLLMLAKRPTDVLRERAYLFCGDSAGIGPMGYALTPCTWSLIATIHSNSVANSWSGLVTLRRRRARRVPAWKVRIPRSTTSLARQHKSSELASSWLRAGMRLMTVLCRNLSLTLCAKDCFVLPQAMCRSPLMRSAHAVSGSSRRGCPKSQRGHLSLTAQPSLVACRGTDRETEKATKKSKMRMRHP